MKPPRHPAAVALLALPALLYRWAVTWRNRHYDRPGSSVRVGRPVISIGNLTTGGTGKTPLVAWLAGRLVAGGRRPAIVSRGYRGRAGKGPHVVADGTGVHGSADRCGDEPYLLASTLEGVVVIVGSDRVEGARAAEALDCDVVLLDDGFQHRRLHRDLDVVLLDSSDPFGGQRLLPAGTLREPLASLGRADVVVITRSGEHERFAEIERTVRTYNGRAPIVPAGHRAVGFFDAQGRQTPQPASAVAFCGIGNPGRFRRDLEQLGVEIVSFHARGDHEPYRRAELAALGDEARANGAAMVTTEKDLARLGTLNLTAEQAAPIRVLRIEVSVHDPRPLVDAIDRLLAREASP